MLLCTGRPWSGHVCSHLFLLKVHQSHQLSRRIHHAQNNRWDKSQIRWTQLPSWQGGMKVQCWLHSMLAAQQYYGEKRRSRRAAQQLAVFRFRGLMTRRRFWGEGWTSNLPVAAFHTQITSRLHSPPGSMPCFPRAGRAVAAARCVFLFPAGSLEASP